MLKRTSKPAVRRAGWIAVLGVAAALTAGISYAAIPSADGTISACIDPKGTVKVIDADNGATCGAGKQLLTWNQQGPQGLPGVSGYEQVNATSSYNSNSTKELVLSCPDGKQPLGGGAYISLYNGLTPAGVALTRSYPNGNEWIVDANEIVPTADAWSMVGNVSCGVVQ
jgi:hypothetical protein